MAQLKPLSSKRTATNSTEKMPEDKQDTEANAVSESVTEPGMSKISMEPAKTDPAPSLADKPKTKTSWRNRWSNLRTPYKAGLIALAVILLLLLVSGTVLALSVRSLIPPMQATADSVKATMASLQNRDLVETKANLELTRQNLQTSKARYQRMGWLNYVPLARNYYLDGSAAIEAGERSIEAGELLVNAIEPYADLLGLVADGETEAASETAEDRIVFVVQTLDAIAPQLDEISDKLSEADEALSRINPNRYPEQIAGRQIRSNIILVQNSLDSAAQSLSEARPLIALLPELLGQEEEKLYMLLFQNDGEIRPTGGFMTAYAYIRVNKGQITPLDSYDIYDLDARWGRTLPAPPPIRKYLPLVNNWNLRDMNLSPDLKVSMDTFTEHYRDIPGAPQFDGIIVMDTALPVAILEIIGPVGVGGWGNFSAEIDQRCDCPQVVYALESIISTPGYAIREDRKAVLGPLMHSLLANAMGSPKALWPQLLNAGIASIKEKHVMFYFSEDENQLLAEAMNAAGRIVEFDGDYLHVNDSNFGGAKSDLFIERSVEEEIELSGDGKVSKTVTLTYNNPFPPSNCNLEAGQLCLNGVYRDWVRLYVPLGATLLEVIGSEVEAETSEDLGKTVFEAFFTMRPQSSSKLVFRYELPGTYSTPYPYLIQKQPGKDVITHEIIFNGKPHTIELASDTRVDLD
jgi:hypothetical protein